MFAVIIDYLSLTRHSASLSFRGIDVMIPRSELLILRYTRTPYYIVRANTNGMPLPVVLPLLQQTQQISY